MTISALRCQGSIPLSRPSPTEGPLATPDPIDAAEISAQPQTIRGDQTLGFRAAGQAFGSALAGIKLVGYGALMEVQTRLDALVERNQDPLADRATPTLERPFVFIPGWTTKPTAFGHVGDMLSRDGANGGQVYFVKQGQIFTRDSELNLTPAVPQKNAKVFEMIWSDMDAICKATGEPKLDVQAYSMGGIDARLYLDQGGDQIHRLMTVSTPNEGTSFGDLTADVLDRNVKWALNISGITSDDRDSMEWLRSEKNSAPLKDLDSRIPKQDSSVDGVLTVGVDRMATPALPWLTGGDSLVSHTSAGLPGATNVVLHDWISHDLVNNDPHVEDLREKFFSWSASSSADPGPGTAPAAD
jgi:triacylglycerol esterase/lipase EstA (alpha/beta hydrolase family)